MTSSSEFGRRGVVMAPAAPAPTYGGTPPRGAASGPVSLGNGAFQPLLQLLFSFNGRIRRRDYWLAHISVTVAMLLGLWFEISMQGALKGNVAGLLLMLPFSLALPVFGIWSGFAVQVKRWHDRDKSGWWVLINFVPIIGFFWLLIECGILDGTPGPNRFGPSPKGVSGPAAVAT